MGEDIPHGSLRHEIEGEGTGRIPKVLQLQKHRMAGGVENQRQIILQFSP